MSQTLQQILGSALQLPATERLELAEALYAASEPPTPEPTGEAWVSELQHRSRQIEAGEVSLSPWEEVKRRVRLRVEGRRGG